MLMIIFWLLAACLFLAVITEVIEFVWLSFLVTLLWVCQLVCWLFPGSSNFFSPLRKGLSKCLTQ